MGDWTTVVTAERKETNLRVRVTAEYMPRSRTAFTTDDVSELIALTANDAISDLYEALYK